jgi:NAD(P)-dependent dehydrogenase (short-subunit alcohol dehydrogenase family)
MRANNKVVVIAGAGGRQGTTAAVLFAREGAKVVLAGLDGAAAQADAGAAAGGEGDRAGTGEQRVAACNQA